MAYHIHTYSSDSIVTNRTIITICEGMSDYAYFQEINRVFKDENIPIRFVPRQADSGHFTSINNKFINERKNNPRSEIIIVVDYDIYQNNISKNMDKYRTKANHLPNFLFNHQNYEDVILLHLSKDDIKRWQNICEQNNHFTNPLSSDAHCELFKKHILNNYKKGDFPFEYFDINTILNAINNNTSETKIHSEFLEYLRDLLVDINVIIKD